MQQERSSGTPALLIMKPVISAHLHAGHTSSSGRLLHRFAAIFQSGSVRLAEIPSRSSSELHLLAGDVVTGHSGDVRSNPVPDLLPSGLTFVIITTWKHKESYHPLQDFAEHHVFAVQPRRSG